MTKVYAANLKKCVVRVQYLKLDNAAFSQEYLHLTFDKILHERTE